MTTNEEGYEQGIRDMVKKEQQLGLDKARQLAKYQGVTSLNRDQAMEIMDTIWADAPHADKLAAAMLCATYGLNPLANHIFLIPYKDGRTGETTWARVWGIRAKRLLATRRGTFSYLDMSPRLMTADEQIKVWGEVDKENLCYLTHLKDMKTGAEVYGYGKWQLKNAYGKPNLPKGCDKGNSMANMASIRSESQAIDRLRSAEMPSGFTVTDEDYVDAEVSESPEVHTTNITFPRPATITPDNATKQGTGTETGEITQEQAGNAVTAEGIEEKVSRIDEEWLDETLTIIHWSQKTAKSWLSAQLKVQVDGTLLEVLNTLDDKGLKTFTEHIRLMRESAGK